MALLPPSLSSSAPAPSGAASASSTSSPSLSRGEDVKQGDSESFGDVLSRSLAASGEMAAKPGGKPAASLPVKRLADEKGNDLPEAINTAAMLFVPLETRVAKAMDGDNGTAAASTAVTSALSSSPAVEVPASPANATPSGAAAMAVAAGDDPLAGDAETQAPQTRPTSGLPAAPAKGTESSELTQPPIAGDETAISLPAFNTALPVSAAHGHQEEGAPGHEQRPGGEARDVPGTDTHAEPKAAVAAGAPATAAHNMHDETTGNATQVSAQAGTGEGSDPAMPATAPGFGLSATPPPVHANASAPNPVAAAAPQQAALTPEVGSGEWGKALGRQMLHMGKAGEQVAELQLNPPGLGPLKVTLSLNDNQVQAFFVSAHASVRAAVEAALPQLRGTLADNGLSLGNTSVDAGTQQQPAFAQGQGQDNRHSRPAYAAADAATPPATAGAPPRPRGKVDIYA
jgi:flagellar hook-length control protein FliK